MKLTLQPTILFMIAATGLADAGYHRQYGRAGRLSHENIRRGPLSDDGSKNYTTVPKSTTQSSTSLISEVAKSSVLSTASASLSKWSTSFSTPSTKSSAEWSASSTYSTESSTKTTTQTSASRSSSISSSMFVSSTTVPNSPTSFSNQSGSSAFQTANRTAAVTSAPLPMSSTRNSTSFRNATSMPAALADLPDDELWAYLNEIDKCVLPTTKDVPIDHVPTQSNGSPLDFADLEMWSGLRMNEWLDKVFQTCPAVKDARCNVRKGEGDKCDFTTSFARLMIGGQSTRSSATLQEFQGFKCDSLSCAWGEASTRRGTMSASDVYLSLSKDASADEILTYRRWYALLAMQNIWRYHMNLNKFVEQVFLDKSLQIHALVEDFGGKELAAAEPPTTPGDIFVNLIKGIAKFVPFGEGIMTGLDIVDGIVAASKGDLSKAASQAKKHLGKAHSTLGDAIVGIVSVSKELGLTDNGSKKPNNDKAKYKPVKISDFGETIKNMLTGIRDGAAASAAQSIDNWEGYLSMAKTGLFSSWQAKGWVVQQKAAKAYGQWLTDRLVMEMYRANKLWLFQAKYPNLSACQADIAARTYFPGEVCHPQADGSAIIIIPFTAFNGVEVKEPVKSYYDGFTAEKLSKWGINQGPVIIKSKECYRSTNAAWLADEWGGAVCSMNRNLSPAKTWPEEEDGEFGSDPRDRLCHWNIPVLETDISNVNAAIRRPWYYSQDRQCLDTFQRTGWPCQDLAWKQYGFLHAGSVYGELDNVDHYLAIPSFDNKTGRNGFADYFWGSFVRKGGRPFLSSGPAMYYARALFYPDKDQCSINSLGVLPAGVARKQAPVVGQTIFP